MPSHKAWAGLQPSQPGAHFKGSVLTGRDQMKLSCEVKNVLRGGGRCDSVDVTSENWGFFWDKGIKRLKRELASSDYQLSQSERAQLLWWLCVQLKVKKSWKWLRLCWVLLLLHFYLFYVCVHVCGGQGTAHRRTSAFHAMFIWKSSVMGWPVHAFAKPCDIRQGMLADISG